ncbi:hypothetical protein EMPS_06441 [Entomortierella parvispora]|uniref:F-box domain-containing protein n=1 Tax=Entomortierella parvispora TaxID=205924 RepID=A0A9P3HCQ2_9FUNG|nr:hypothetical protein EMPS_06441 [Entomortierella parvispora]
MALQAGGKRARLLPPSSSLSSSLVTACPTLPHSGHGSPMSPQRHTSEPWLRDPMTFFSEELALHIFEDLTPADLGKCARVSKLWHRLVNDQMLWRRLFLKNKFVFPRGIERSGTAQDAAGSGRRILLRNRRQAGSTQGKAASQQPTLQRQRQQPQQRYPAQQYQMSNAYQCWKAVYRLNYNWLMGQARVTSLPIMEMLKQDQAAIERLGGLPPNQQSTQSSFPPLVRFKGSVVIVASPVDFIHLWRMKPSSTFRQSATPSPSPTEAESSFSSRTMGCDDAPQKLEYWQTYVPSVPRSPSEEVSGRVSYIALDKSVTGSPSLEQRVMVGYESGHFSIFAYQESSPENGIDVESVSLREIGNTASLPAWSAVEGIQSAAFHYPILITTSSDGTISIYKIQEQDSSQATQGGEGTRPWCRLLHRLYGLATESPVEILLEPVKSGKEPRDDDQPEEEEEFISKAEARNERGSQWRAIVSFGLQLLDGSWTVRLQEIGFDNLFIHYSTEAGTENAPFSDTNNTVTSNNEHVLPSESGFNGGAIPIEESFSANSNMTSPASCTTLSDNQVRIGAISAIDISWPFVVTTHRDNTMNVFQMTRQTNSVASAATRLKLQFEHLSTLYGHCGAVSSVAIEPRSGRLVSAGMDRSIKVWALTLQRRRLSHHPSQQPKSSQSQSQPVQSPTVSSTTITTTRVHQCIVSMSDINKSWTESGQVTTEEGRGLIWVGSDEDKIVSMNCDGTVKVWQFT